MPALSFENSSRSSKSDTSNAILRAALTCFSNYGFRKTTVEDIASEAGVSRPTLYAYYKNKKAILRTISECMHSDTLGSIETQLQSDVPLANKLEESFWVWSEPFMSTLFGTPHGAELIEANSSLASDISENARKSFVSLLAAELEKQCADGQLDLTAVDLNAERAAEFLVFALNGLSRGEADERTYRDRLKVLASVFLTATKPRSST